MSDIKQAQGTLTSFTTTNLASLAASATAGWQSDGVDNSTNLYLDYHVYLSLASAAYGTTAGQTVYIFGAGSIDGNNYTSQGNGQTGPTGTEGTITVPSVVTGTCNLPLLGTATLLGTAAQKIGPFSVARGFGGVMPVKFSIVIINNTAAAFATAVAKYIGVYNTVI